ncbi:putative uncharacterized protein [Vibrio anguillarum]|uniref:DUF5666 domain-containing protein n=5 Tax=Vibrio anguillarum TaxID=55601 RepID=A0AAW4AR97_VIBAN|nr:hypothetical protein [Vibrio anguillarum]QYS24665.1 hypothetical protein fNO16VIB134_0014 [Vibrio phage NO16-like VIB134]QYS24711.1 hypothetical protein fNO16VIB88_0014 [Vibrio phage NO16-like VIB88]QYS24734.1 hypothetical protein fNO16VIB1_0014 [Vibrio phage NO16-like VIB1]QYS24757.1 hypothetical protein fNO16NB10_0014 [Vibrio phage NO16-like NB10]QYS24803.1 hypothetical protein fNO16117890_0014 [Vibrio phage NO16-like 1178_90]
MPVTTVTAKPVPAVIATSGRNFQLLSGGEVTVKFYGVNGDWEEEVELSVGDSLEFEQRFARFTVQTQYETRVSFYSGFAKMRRSKQDLVVTGTTSIKTSQKQVTKVESMLIEPNRNRRNVVVFPLNDTIYVGGLGTSQNDKLPVPVGGSITLDTQAAIYVTQDQSSANDFADVRILEEFN